MDPSSDEVPCTVENEIVLMESESSRENDSEMINETATVRVSQPAEVFGIGHDDSTLDVLGQEVNAPIPEPSVPPPLVMNLREMLQSAPAPGPSSLSPPSRFYFADAQVALINSRIRNMTQGLLLESPGHSRSSGGGARLMSVRTHILSRLLRARSHSSTRSRRRNTRSDRILTVIERIANRHLEVKRIKEENRRRRLVLEEKKLEMDERLERIEKKLDLILARVSKSCKRVRKGQ